MFSPPFLGDEHTAWGQEKIEMFQFTEN